MRNETRSEWPAGGTLTHRPVAPVETVAVWYPGQHPYVASVEGEDWSPCKVCAPWGIGAHVHYPSYEYVAPGSVYLVTFSDYDDERLDSVWYDEAKAVAKAESLNRVLWEEDRARWTETRERFAPAVAAMTDGEVARADAAAIAHYAKERGVRVAARKVRDAISALDYDPRDAIEWADGVLAQTFEDWMEKSPGTKWRVGGMDVEDSDASPR